MRNAKLWSVLLAAVLLCACIAGVLYLGAGAEGAEIYGVNYAGEEVASDKQYQTIGEVFEEVRGLVEAGNWPAGKSLEIRFTGTINAKAAGSDLMFGQKTVFTAPGQKLPITIKGMDANKASKIVVDADRIACANDYTFEELTLDNWTNGAQLFAGSGQVTLRNLASVADAQAKLGCLFADNFTAEAYAGWTRADMEALMDEDNTVLSALAFDGYSYNHKGGNSTTTNIAAVGAAHPADNYSAAASDDGAFVITPASTKAKIHWIGGTAGDVRLGGYRAASPARVHTVILELDGGKLAQITGDDGQSGVAQNIVNGNIEVDAENVTLNGTPIRIFLGTTTLKNVASESVDPENFDNTKYGNITVKAKNLTGGTDYYLAGSNNLEIDGKFTADFDGCKYTAASPGINYIGFYGKQGVENRFSNMTFTAFYATRQATATGSLNCEIKNIFNNVTCATFDATGFKPSTATAFHVDKVTNEFTGCTFTQDVYAIGYATDVDEVETTFDSCTLENIAYYGGSKGGKGTIGKITNYVKETVEGETCSIDSFYGLRNANATGTVLNEISGGAVTTFYGARSVTIDGNVENKVTGGEIGSHTLTADNKFNQNNRTYYYGMGSATVTGDVKNTVTGGLIHAYQGSNGGSAANVVNEVTGGEIGFDKASGDYAHFYGASGTTATNVKNYLKGGTVYSFHGLSNSTSQGVDEVYNEVSGATIKHGFVGAYNPPSLKSLKLVVTSGEFKSAMYAFYGAGANHTSLDIINEISGGNFAGTALFGGYGGDMNTVTTTISGDAKFTGSGSVVAFAPGNNNWPGRCQSVETTIEGGTFSGNVFGGSYSGQVVNDVKTTIKSGTFNGIYYGGNYASAKERSSSVISGIPGKAIQGKIINIIGEVGKSETAPVFNKAFYGGNHGITDAGYLINRDNCTIENTVNEGTFNGTYHGGNSNVAYRTKAVVEAPEIQLNITNTIKGGMFKNTESYMGAGPEGSFVAGTDEVVAKVVGGEIKNEIYGGIFVGNFCGAFNQNCASMTLDITNHFYGGQIQGTENNHLGCEAGTEIIGVITNIFEDGFTTDSAYIYGAGNGIVRAPEGEQYAVINVINGGEFDGFWGAGGKANLRVYGNVKTTVNGGTFNGYSSKMPNSIAGGPRNGTLVGDIELTINGGTFTADVVGGTIWGSQTSACDTIDGNVTTTITGGDFKGDIYALSRYSAEDLKATGTVTLNVVQTAGKALKFGGAVSIDSFTAIDEPVEIGKKATLAVAALTGTLNLKQTEGWIARDYAILPAGASYAVLESADCFGKYATDASVKVYGLGIEAAGATIILDEKLGARILFNKDAVDLIGSDFEVEVKLGEIGLAKASYKNLTEYRGYYSIVVNGIGLLDYANDFTVSGQASLTISMEDLVNMGQKTWDGAWLDLCNALENLHNVYNLDQSGAYTPEAVANQMTARRGDAGAQIQSVTASLLMSDAAGVRLNMVLRANPENLKVMVNGVTVDECATVTEITQNDVTVYNVQIDLFFKAAAMEDTFRIVISSDAGTYMTYGDTVANLAYQLATKTDNEFADNAEALLYYIQKACDCIA